MKSHMEMGFKHNPMVFRSRFFPDMAACHLADTSAIAAELAM